MCGEIEYLFVNFRFLLSWRNLSINFTVFWNNRQLIGSCLYSLGICFWEGYHHILHWRNLTLCVQNSSKTIRMAWHCYVVNLILEPRHPNMRKSFNDVTKRCKPERNTENHWSHYWERMKLMEHFCNFHKWPVPTFKGNTFIAQFNLVCSVHHLQNNQFMITFRSVVLSNSFK